MKIKGTKTGKETKDGLPVGMQFMAAWEHDDALLDIAKKLEK